MKTFFAILAVTLTAFLATTLANDAQKKDLKIVYNLSGVLQTLENKELVITFSDDMLPLGGKSRAQGSGLQIPEIMKEPEGLGLSL